MDEKRERAAYRRSRTKSLAMTRSDNSKLYLMYMSKKYEQLVGILGVGAVHDEESGRPSERQRVSGRRARIAEYAMCLI